MVWIWFKEKENEKLKKKKRVTLQSRPIRDSVYSRPSRPIHGPKRDSTGDRVTARLAGEDRGWREIVYVLHTYLTCIVILSTSTYCNEYIGRRHIVYG